MSVMSEKFLEKAADSNSVDDLELKEMGYIPTLHRGLNAFMNFAFGFTEVAVLASVCITYGFGLSCGGPSVIIWGFFINFFFTMIIAANMAEICSAYPSAGSVYHWAGQLAPPSSAPLWSYFCGWANFLGNAAGDASFGNAFGSFLSAALISSGYSGISPRNQVPTSIGVLLLWSILNFFRVDRVGWVNNLAAICHGVSIIIILVALLSLAPKLATAEYVFTHYNNDTGFSSQSYVITLGITTALFSFAGYEASAHMAEETSSSSTSAPWGIIFTCLATGIGGLVVLLGLLFATTDIASATDGSTGNAASEVFLLACGPTWGATLTWLVVVNLFFAGISSVTVTGRITYALTRDGAFPYSAILSLVHPTLKSPVNAIMLVFVFDALLMLLLLDPDTGAKAFYSIVGLATIGFQISYAVPIILKVVYQPEDFPQTRLSLGRWSTPMGIVSSLWLCGTSILFFFPSASPVTPSSMNWLVVVVGFIVLLGTVNWLWSGQFVFTGPKRRQQSSSRSNSSNPSYGSGSSGHHKSLVSSFRSNGKKYNGKGGNTKSGSTENSNNNNNSNGDETNNGLRFSFGSYNFFKDSDGDKLEGGEVDNPMGAGPGAVGSNASNSSPPSRLGNRKFMY